MDRQAFFENLSSADQPLAFKPEHTPRLERLHRRLGDLRGKRVFEPGCGAGPLTALLADWVGSTGHVLALDACSGMAARCEEAVAGHRHVRVCHARVEDHAAPPGVWDLILCFRLYPHLEKPEEFLRRCAAWMAPGGELVIANLEGSRELNEIHAQHRGVHRDRMPAAAELRRQLEAHAWQVLDAIDEPEDFFLRARRA